VDEKQVAALAIAAAELAHPVLLERLDELVDELFSRHVKNSGLRPLGTDAMCDGMNQVRLAEPRATTEEERVVTRAAAACRTDGRRMSELVRRADDEVAERVLRIEAFERRCDGFRRRRTPRCRRHLDVSLVRYRRLNVVRRPNCMKARRRVPRPVP